MATDSLDMTSNDWKIVRENLVQLHCEDVSWEQASDKIPLDLVRYLLGDLVQHLSTLIFLRGNRCLFTINWTHIPDSISVWENLLSDFFDKRIQTQVGHYRFTYMLSHVGPKYDDLVNVYCHAHWGSPHPSFRREDVWEAGTLQPMEHPEMLYLPPSSIYMNGVATTALFDTGAEIQLVSKQFCEDNEWEIQPIEKLTECSTVNGEIFGYEGFVEVNVQIPGRDFSEDHLFLATSEIGHQKEIPVVLGTYFIESLSKYLHGIDKNEFDSLDYTVKQAYLSWVEATRIREKYGCEPPLGFVKTTKPVLIQAGTSREIHGLLVML